MTRHISSYISVLLTAALALVSCEKEPVVAPADSQTLTLCLSPCDMQLTRAASSEYGDEDYNENVISDFKLYFYTSDSESEAATYIYPASDELASITNVAGDGYRTNGLTVDPTSGKVTLKLALDKATGAALFPSGTASNCYVYAVANTGSLRDPSGNPVTLPSTSGSDDTRIENLRKLPVLAEFGPTKTSEPYAEEQSDFVMDGKSTLTLDENQNASGTVELTRAAAKITFYVAEIKDVVDYDADGETVLGTWTADTGKMHVCYRNTVNYGYINGTPSSVDSKYIVDYSTSQARPLSAFTTSEGKTNWTHSLPFYSYPHEWNTINDDDAPYLLLQIPWKYTSETEGTAPRYFTCYYAVPFNSVSQRIDRNTWYKVSLSVSILGSGDPDNPSEIMPSYMILPWGSTPVQTNADLKRYKYLLVDQDSYVMNNVDELEIPFYSSHEVELESAKITKTILKPSSGYMPSEQEVTSGYTVDLDNSSLPGKSKLTFKHTLVNNYSNTAYDVTAYSVTITFKHKDDPDFTETVTITQYPALYVVASLNSDCSNPSSSRGLNGNGNHSANGYVYVNEGGQCSTSGGNDDNSWGIVTTGGNYDPYMYVISVSSLPVDSEFVIGDPRTEDVSVPTLGTYQSGWWTTYTYTEKWGEDNNFRTITNYYPTDTDSRTNNMIAPSFRIASSYGVVTPLTYSGAQKRCASYQEDGYPAGRWRVPTQAEIWYMVKLASDGKIPELLTTTSYYWGGDGRAYRPSTDFKNPVTTTSASYVRCVYDEWYWKDKCDKETFTWGDRAR